MSYQNAVSERINSTFKYEYGLKQTIKNTTFAKNVTKRAVDLNNNLRPHLSLDLMTLDYVHINQNVSHKRYRSNKQNLEIRTI